MARKISVKPVERIELEFADGTKKDILFSAASVATLDEEFDGALKVVSKIQTQPYETGAKIIYAGMKVCDDSITLDEVKALTVEMPFDIIMELIEEFTNNLSKTMNKKDIGAFKKDFIKEILQNMK
ncbi:hypothetical protein [Natronincola ferrireducens]|uniref:Phage tail assembly chaperone protein, E, or 41 or 14 n=1 Tax=Natronincola ferrireducens TaxID=393762 RepID=A0A1G9I636_9FIRM|nr:hypothetical protein [Natronincola ferrireducens]SDL20689.1 hypothetical protein SAMN05660472_02809 [Natronincola ferrireducens]